MSLTQQKMRKIDITMRELLKMVKGANNGLLLSSDLFDEFVTENRNKRHIQLAIRNLEGDNKLMKFGCLKDARKYWLRMV